MSKRGENFRERVEDLVTLFEGGIDRDEWSTRRYPKRLRDDDQFVYEVTSLYLQKGPTRLLLDPLGDDMLGTEGAADIYQMPAYDPAASLYFEGGRWVLHYASPTDPAEAQALELTAETINRVLDSIAEHAVPSI